MRFGGLDLNLLTAFQALMLDRSVTHAARRLHLSQPATSSALARLREFFDDELFVASGRTMRPTAKAEALLPFVEQLLGDAERLVAASTRFDPRHSERQFRIAGSDYIFAVLLVPLIAQLQSRAPNVRFKLVPPTITSIADLERGEIDLVLMPEQYQAVAHPSVLIFEEPHVVVGWNGNPALQKALDLAAFCAQPHVVVELGSARAIPFAEDHIRRSGFERRVDVTVNSFAAVPGMLPNTTRIAVLQERLARGFASWLPLTIAPLPFEMPMMREVAQYHRTRDNDEGLHWLLGEMQAAARAMDEDRRAVG